MPDGTLRGDPLRLIERMAPKPPKRVKVDKAVKLAQTDAAIKRWQTKAKRAATVLRKLNLRASVSEF